MPCFPPNATALNYISYPVGPVSFGTTFTSGGSAHLKGSYVEFVASSPFTTERVGINIQTTVANSVRGFLFDLAVGALGAEFDIVPNMLNESTNGVNTSHTGLGHVILPLKIPSGSRIALRSQCSTANSNMAGSIELYAAGSDCEGVASYTNYGSLTASSRGTQFSPSDTTPDTKTAWVEFEDSTPFDIQSIVIMAATNGAAHASSPRWYVDIGYGPEGEEVVVLADVKFAHGADTEVMVIRWREYPCFIPAGSRLCVRVAANVTSSERVVDIALLVAEGPAE